MKSTWWSFRGQTTGKNGAALNFQTEHRQKAARHAAVPQLSENSDIQTETASRRDFLSLLHKFVRCAKRRKSLFPCPLAVLRGVGSQIVVSSAHLISNIESELKKDANKETLLEPLEVTFLELRVSDKNDTYSANKNDPPHLLTHGLHDPKSKRKT